MTTVATHPESAVAAGAPTASPSPVDGAADGRAENGPDRSARLPERSRWALLGHLAIYLLLIVGLLATTNLKASWSVDDGAYATQVKVLQETGGWAYPYAFAAHDPQMIHTPVSLGTVTTDGRLYPYTKLPAWIEVLRTSVRIFGDPLGFYVPSVLGALGAAAAGWWLAGRFARRLQPWAFWAVGAGPLLVHTTAMWAHTTGAALGGVCAVLLLDIVRGRGDWRRVAGLAVALAALCLIRNEGLLLAASTLVVLGVTGLRRAGSPVARVLTAAKYSVLPAAFVVGAYKGSQRWAAHVAPGPYLAQTVDQWYHVTWLQGRWPGMVHTFFSGGGSMPLATRWATVAVVLFLVGGVVLARAAHGSRVMVVGIGAVIAGLVLVVLRSVWLIPIDLGGLLVAAPLLSLAVGSFRWGRLSRAARTMVVWCGLYGLAVLLTEYPEGGSRDWGGRYLFVALVPALVGAVALVARLVDAAPAGIDRRALTGLLVAAVCLPTMAGLIATHDVRNGDEALTVAALAPHSQVVIRTQRAWSREAWRVLPDADWLTSSISDVPSVVAVLRTEGVQSVTVTGPGVTVVRVAGYRRQVVSPDVVVFRRAGA